MRLGGAVAGAELRSWELTTGRLRWLAGCLVLVLAGHLTRLPGWVILTFVLLALWAERRARRARREPPSRWLLAAIGLALAGAVALEYGTLFGRGPGVALLAVLAGMKLVEARSARDAYLLVGLSAFLAVTVFLYSQSLAAGLYLLAVALAIVAALLALNSAPEELGAGARLRLAATLLVQAAPLMLVLFVLFPRISGPLWGLPKDAGAGRSGLSETMSPGNITRLSLSDEVAFRVVFDGPVPPPAQRYWRGPVLWDTDGRTWTGERRKLRRTLPEARVEGVPVDYTVTLEPHGRRWLLALDLPGLIPPGALISDAHQLVSIKPVSERRRYRMRSWPRYRITRLAPEQRRRALALPPGAHPRARALGRRWRSELGSPAAVVERGLGWLRSEPFHYTLSPPLIEGDVVDGFLFEARRGFCEYFAAGFAVLMRAAGIPARVVTGYQGGSLNPFGDYLVVRQRDAHAWVEVWLEGRGWVRVDPTAAVAPERIELGIDAALPPSFAGQAIGLRAGGSLLRAWQRLRFGWDGLSNAWIQWVLDYDARSQRRLLGRFGLDPRDYLRLAAVLGAALLAGLAGVALWVRRRPRPADPALRLYRRFCARLARAGVARRPWEGPRAYARRAAAALPGERDRIEAITERYVALRYRGDGGTGGLRRALAGFRPRPARGRRIAHRGSWGEAR